MTTPFDLTGKRVLITGAAGGIGSATARACARLGAELVLTDIRDCSALAEELAAGGAKAGAHACDVRDRAAIDALAETVGGVDGLVLNAGAIAFDDWDSLEWEDSFHEIIHVNLLAPMQFARAFLPGMRTRGSARIVLVGSVAGWTGGTMSTTGAHYVVSKGGVHAFTRWLARRAAPDVGVNAVAPSATATPMIAGQPAPAVAAQLVPRVASPDEIAWPIAFLCSPAASFLSGVVLDINGGAYLR
ncbi:SDR family NAD(P)-dependent oxidoreductase [Azospirillum agricola]|uniref:SDR family NAD(P)-dependent oxidoreductase n=1 Tax=Azospirillum agricola TaxID=1720247 RepID=UPI000A0F1FC7|nr:SDR family NAD(P)-dependent oxidoreductase [Azospirillum agricola]SMH36856.1 3-oxoacyl-[acyl-carrier protein] reductase [Azospirillum lipoferum]